MHRQHAKFIVLCLLVLSLAAIAHAEGYAEGGYASRTSVAAGGTISFHIATAAAPFNVEIVNLAHPNTVLTTLSGLTSAPNDCTGLWETGCAWPVTTQFTVPATWPSGYYAARFPTGSGRMTNLVFVVRSATPGVNKIVVISPTHTYAAYNNFGGKSLEDTQSTNNQRTHIVSFNRPYTDNNGLGRFPMWEQQFVDWMTAESRAFDVITDEDAEDAALLNKYQGIVIVGQSEYWTLAGRTSLETFITTGSPNSLTSGRGDIAILGGSTMLWQARTNPETRQLICYKDRALDPENGVHNDVVTVHWADEPVSRPENALIGGSFRTAGHANEIPGTEDPLPDAERKPYTVLREDHWLLANTGLTNGQTFGPSAAGTRVDGANFTLMPGPSGHLEPYSDGSDGSPYTLEIVAAIPAEKGYGLISIYTTREYGRVLNVGTRDWSHGLLSDGAVQQITRNVMNKLEQRGSIFWTTPFIRPLALTDGFEMPSPRPGIVPGWSGDLRGGSLGAACLASSSGLKLQGAEPIHLSRNFTPANDPLADAEVSLGVSFGDLQAVGASPLRLVTLANTSQGVETPYAAVEVDVQSGQARGRAVSLDGSGNVLAATTWQTADSNSYAYFRMRWRAGGTIEFSSYMTETIEVSNGDGGQRVNTLVLNYAGSNAGVVGAVCLNGIQVRDPSTTMTISSSLNPSVAGNTVQLTALIGPWGFYGNYAGTITLKEGSTIIGSKSGNAAVATFDLSNLTPGAHTFVATYSGSADYLGSTSAPFSQVINRRVRSDLNGDGKSDIVLQNSNPARIAWWLMDNVSIASGSAITVAANPESMITGDLHGDGSQYFVWQNSSGTFAGEYLFRIPTGALQANQDSITTANPAWHLIASRDFTGDGRADMILRNKDTGAVALWQMNGPTILAGTVIGNPGLNLLPIDAGNFGGNAIIFQNQTTGAISRWLVNGTTVTSDQVIATPATGWKVVAVGDFDGDGFDDLALQNSSTRAVAIWLLDSVGTTITKGAVIATPVDGWKVVGAGDYDGNGRSDLLLHNALTNSIAQWQMNGTEIVKGWTITTAPGWKPLGR